MTRKKHIGTFTAEEELLELYNIDRCPECHCCTGDDTQYKDFSNKYIIVCAQCGYEWDTREMKPVRKDYRKE